MNGKGVLIGASATLALLAVAGVAAPVIAPDGHEPIDLLSRLSPPLFLGGSVEHPLGTDELGRDILARLLYSIRVTIIIALVATMIGAVVGTTVGLLAAAAGGWLDETLMLIVDAQAALPYILLVLLVLSAFGSELQYFVVLLGLYGWERYARLARSQAVSAREQGYALAISAVGASPARLYLRHILPNISSALIVTATLTFPQIVLLESSLSFLGLGVQPPQTSLGNMVAFGRDYLMTAWWIVAAPAIVILITSLAFTLLGETLRDRLDPTLADRS